MKRLLVVVLVVVAAGCGGGGEEAEEPAAPAAGAGAEQTITIDEVDFRLEPSTVRLDRAGTYTFRAVNKGETDHALEVEGNGAEEETETIAPGESATLTIQLEEGTYELYCPIGNHRQLGMDGSVVVGTAAGGTTGTTTGETETEDEDESGGGGSDY